MEFLFITQWASAEAILLFVCLGIFVIIYGHDGYLFLRRFIDVFFPKKPVPEPIIQSGNEFDTVQDVVVSPMLWETVTSSEEEITPQIGEVPEFETNRTGDIEEEAPVPEWESEAWTEEVVLVAEDEVIWTPVVPEELTQGEWTSQEAPIIVWTEDVSITTPPEGIEEIPSLVSEAEISLSVVPETTQEEIPEEAQEPVQESIISEVWVLEAENKSPINPEESPIDEVTDTLPDEEKEESAQASPTQESSEQEESVHEIKAQEEEIVQKTFLEEDYTDIQSRQDLSTPTQEYTPQENTTKNTELPKNSPQVQEKIYQLLGAIKTLVARGQTLEARGLIIQWLALHQEHRDLNIILGSLFEQDRHFDKAELVYKDLAEWYPNDIEILEKLGNVLIIQRRYTIAFEIYKKILIIWWETEAALYIITHLASELGLDQEKYDLAKRYLKQWPNNPEVLALLAQSEIILNLRQDAIKTLIKLKNLTPYNGEIMETVQKLMMEEEMAGNFGG
jgi:tetratricopeptide (TPR) repeat protein